MSYNPYDDYPGGFSENDGTIDFYSRINALIREDMTILDLGAGRGAWYENDTNYYRRALRTLQGKVQRVVAVDIDEAVLENRTSDEQYLIKDGEIPLGDRVADMVIADYVLEHVDDVVHFAHEVDRVLKPGGWFCARTPHKYSYVSIAARLLRNPYHTSVLSKVQPGRKESDIFPTLYKMNTMKVIGKQFSRYKNFSFCFQTDPAYYFGSRRIFKCQRYLHQVTPKSFSGNIFAFLLKGE